MKILVKRLALSLAIMLAAAAPSWAEEAAKEASKINPGDTAWMLISSALVMLMTPGLALFYAGMVRRKNVLGTIMHSFIILCIISIQWVLFGYTLAFGPDIRGLIGNMDWLGLKGVGGAPSDYANTIPHMAFMAFQMMFAVITPALITGAFAERIKFSTFAIFSLLWATLVYDPLAHWVWGGGWLQKMGVLDFAGGIVVHISAGISALACALFIGKRKGYGSEPMPPHNLPLMMLGMGLLWFGWFGFNGGSALTSGALATVAFVVTNTAAASGALAWTFIEWVHRKKPTILGAASGAVAGLGAITPASGFVDPLAAIAIGVVSGALCYLAVNTLKAKLNYDDSLDVFGIHGVGGTWGVLATGLFAQKAINSAGADGLFYGNPSLLWNQLVAVAATWVYTFGFTILILLGLKYIMGLRLTEEDEMNGLDLSQHGERGYSVEYEGGAAVHHHHLPLGSSSPALGFKKAPEKA